MTRARSANPEQPPPADTGCAYHPACLSCPEPVCILYERPIATAALHARIREEHAAKPALSHAALGIRLGCCHDSQVKQALATTR